MKLFIAEAKSREDTRLAFEQEEDGVDDENLRQIEGALELRFECRHWKWYSEFEAVKAHEEIINLARGYSEREDAEGKVVGDVGYAFARIGEDMDDMDIFGSDDYYDLLDIERSIRIY